MSAASCARTASDLTLLVHRLGRTRTALARQARLPEEDFGGLSGDAYRRHVARSAATVAAAASDLALLAGAVAALGRALASAEELRDLAAGSPPERARELRVRARQVERRGQQRWREAVATYEGRPVPGPEPRTRHHGRPVVPGTTLGPVADPAVPAAPVAATPSPTPVLPAADPVAAPAVVGAPEPVLDSALVVPPTRLQSELVPPPTGPTRCGTPEVLGELD